MSLAMSGLIVWLMVAITPRCIRAVTMSRGFASIFSANSRTVLPSSRRADFRASRTPAPKGPRRVVCAASASARCLPEICPSRSCGAAGGALWGADLSAGCRPCAAGRSDGRRWTCLSRPSRPRFWSAPRESGLACCAAAGPAPWTGAFSNAGFGPGLRRGLRRGLRAPVSAARASASAESAYSA